MTDKELEKKAKEYSQWLYHSKAWNPCEDMLVQAYIAGHKQAVKESTTKWHDLRKDPEDLPERGHKVIVVYHDFDHTHLFAYLREDWVWTTNGHNSFDGIIAWCEIPRYEVE